MTAPFPFIVARGRSGTTLLRAILDSHPDLAIPGESHFAVSFAMRASRYGKDRFDDRLFFQDLLGHWGFQRWGVPEETVRALFVRTPPTNLSDAIRLAYSAYAVHHGKTRYGDKTPSFILHVERLAHLFPEARFIHLIRDGRNVALSYLAADFGVETLGEAAIYWNRYVRAGREAGRRIGPDRYLEVRYEDLVAEPENVIDRICAFVELAFDPAMLRYYERSAQLASTISHAEHHRNISHPPVSTIRNWRNEMTQQQLQFFEAIAGDLLEELGYERSSSRIGTPAALVAYGARTRVIALRARNRARHVVRDIGERLTSSVPSGTAAEEHRRTG